MGVRNYLIEGVSGAGKTTVAEALERRGCHVAHGDRTLAYVGDPATGARLELPAGLDEAARVRWRHEHHIWDVAQVRALVADQSRPMTFFCGGSRNAAQFIGLFDQVFVLELDAATLTGRLAARPADEFGGRPVERALIGDLHASRRDLPAGAVSIDATAPVEDVVDAILARCG